MRGRRKHQSVICLLGTLLLIISYEVFAQSSETPRSPLAGSGLLIGFAIAYLTRRRAIGGWLLYFYMQLYLSFILSLFFISQVFSNLNPVLWDDSFLYVMFFFSVVPILIVELLKIITATVLLFKRNLQNVKLLRNILIASVIVSGLALIIDILYFTDDPAIFFDGITFAFAIIWSLYFSVSRRVKIVFVEQNWSYEVFSPKRILTKEDKKKLFKRALISALITFIVFLLMMGTILEDEGKQPDMGIFGVPIFYAVVAAIIAWYLPIRKKKHDTN